MLSGLDLPDVDKVLESLNLPEPDFDISTDTPLNETQAIIDKTFEKGEG